MSTKLRIGRAPLGLALLTLVALGGVASAQFFKGRDKALAPELKGVSHWINSDPLTIKGLRGKVVIVHFWTFGCYICVNNYPHYKAWRERYANNKDVVILGIHTPETSGERDIKRIKAEALKNGLKFPIAVDNDAENWQAWHNRVWPAVYVVDRKGVARYGCEGELNDNGQKGEETVRQTIDALLLERP